MTLISTSIFVSDIETLIALKSVCKDSSVPRTRKRKWRNKHWRKNFYMRNKMVYKEQFEML